jgi:hypothetical protein
VIITTLAAREEYVELQNIGTELQNLDGWILQSEKGKQDCPLAGTIGPGATLTVWARSEDLGQGGFNCGYSGNIWNNDETDPAVLFDASGVEVDRETFKKR